VIIKVVVEGSVGSQQLWYGLRKVVGCVLSQSFVGCMRTPIFGRKAATT